MLRHAYETTTLSRQYQGSPIRYSSFTSLRVISVVCKNDAMTLMTFQRTSAKVNQNRVSEFDAAVECFAESKDAAF